MQEQEGPLIVDLEGAGEGSVDGSTRQKLVRRLEELRGAVFTEAIKRKPEKRSRQFLAWVNRDKLSTAWLQCLPGPGGLNSAAFSEAMALVLCMPSPACRERVGQKVGSRNGCVDIYGDKIMSSQMPGDHWRTRHDTVKMELASLCAYAKVEHTTEVFGLFAPLIHQQALTRIESGQKRQGLVPDFRLKTTDNTGATRYQLAELKVISCCDVWYAPSASSACGGKKIQWITSGLSTQVQSQENLIRSHELQLETSADQLKRSSRNSVTSLVWSSERGVRLVTVFTR